VQGTSDAMPGGAAAFEAMDSMICMGASIGWTGAALLAAPEQAKRVVSVIGDSTFVHSGITGLVEMVYNPRRAATWCDPGHGTRR